jgi:hypothetical protein
MQSVIPSLFRKTIPNTLNTIIYHTLKYSHHLTTAVGPVQVLQIDEGADSDYIFTDNEHGNQPDAGVLVPKRAIPEE